MDQLAGERDGVIVEVKKIRYAEPAEMLNFSHFCFCEKKIFYIADFFFFWMARAISGLITVWI